VAYRRGGSGGDLLVATSSCRLVVAPHNAGGTLDPARVALSAGACANPTAMAAGDVDEDGNTDVVLLQNGSPRLILGDGACGFAAPQPIPVPAGIGWAQLALFDTDSDGHLDLALWTSLGIDIFRGDGTGAFTRVAGGLGLADQRSRDLVFGDLDHDRTVDLVALIGDSVSPGLSYFPSVTRPERVYKLPAASVYRVFAVAGAFACDGAQQLAVTSGLGIDFLELGTGGTLTTLASATMPGSPGLNQLLAVDVDGDGRPEIAALSSGGVGLLSRRESGWRGAQYSFPYAVGNYNPVQMVIGDFTGDGCPDVAIAGGSSFAGLSVLPGVCP